MDLVNSFQELAINNSNVDEVIYSYIDVFKNPNKLPITQIHLERKWYELRKDAPVEFDISELSEREINKRYYERKNEIIPALDKRWVPKNVLYKYEPYVFSASKEDNITFITRNVLFIDSLDFLLKCNYHQFWCTILYESSAVLALRSYILHLIPWYQVAYLEGEYASVYKIVFNKFICVYKRLLTFKESQTEYMPEDFGFRKLIEIKLINLPIVISLAFMYKNSDLNFVNKLTNRYFNDTSQLDFQIREVEEMINQTLIVLEMVGGHVCGFDENAVIVPISIKKRPKLFDLSWVYSVVNYLLNTLALLNILLQFYKPAVEICLNKELPYRIPFTYVNIYRELYQMLGDREELRAQKGLTNRVFDEINLGRSEFIDVYHVFISSCLDKTLETIGNTKQQEPVVETYLKLLTTALEDDYFICDYNMKYNVANQNEIIESCYPLDTTRTEFIVSCINKFTRHKKLQQLSALKRQTIEDIFKEFKPPELEEEEEEPQACSSQSAVGGPDGNELEEKIRDIMDMFPHLGDGFVLQCLEAYNYNSTDVINAILEENLPPHLYDIPFDTIRIPPEPEPEKPTLAYRGKKPDYDDALKLLNDKRDMEKLKTFVLEGVQYSNDYLYDDEYDDRFDDEVPIKVVDNPIEEEVPTYNPNRDDLASDTSYSSSDEYDDTGKPVTKTGGVGASGSSKSKINFCEDPAVLRERREARYRSKNPQARKKAEVVGKPKGQGQEESVLKARDKKTVNKSSRANHNRKGGAQFKRNRGMIPS